MQFGEDLEVDLVEPDAGSDKPNVVEGHFSELATPRHGYADSWENKDEKCISFFNAEIYEIALMNVTTKSYL